MKNTVKKTEIEDTLKLAIGNMLDSAKNERAVNHSDLLMEMMGAFKAENPESFYFKFQYEREYLIDDAIENSLRNDYPGISDLNLYKIQNIFRYFKEIELFLSRIITKKESHNCCSDKSSNLIKIYVREKLGTLKRELSPTKDRINFFVSRLGDHDRWMSIIDSYIGCLNSKPETFVIEYPVFINHLDSCLTPEDAEKLEQFKYEKYGQKLVEDTKNNDDLAKINHPRICPLKIEHYAGKFRSYQKDPERIEYLKKWVKELPIKIKEEGFVNFFRGYEYRYLSTELVPCMRLGTREFKTNIKFY